ncbi:MAG: bifunctional adenosylcobinamide kinase/adenosylcobinamide-phosphate guanylyltransferase [Bacteroidaceae bacterium]|nr:bifunctional adenosylcobinamide kinase/adenosylcobinamide-phosphate guanylyltransferase [Bacteroidaceae bacterium]
MRRIILITGGQRSGKSTHAEQLALELSPNPVYVATAHIWDDEFRQRVIRHQERRGPQWTNIEEEMHLSRHEVEGRVVLVDCLTLWSTNFFFLNGEEQPVQQTVDAVCAEFDRFVSQDATFIFVTNEIGLGGTSASDVQRHFTDVLGWVNQHVAAVADEVILMVSGIPMKVK